MSPALLPKPTPPGEGPEDDVHLSLREHLIELRQRLKWAVICIMQARTFLDGAVKSVELASLGRRVAEMELELLELTEG